MKCPHLTSAGGRGAATHPRLEDRHSCHPFRPRRRKSPNTHGKSPRGTRCKASGPRKKYLELTDHANRRIEYTEGRLKSRPMPTTP